METTRQLFNAVVNEINSDFNTLKNANKIFKRWFSWTQEQVPGYNDFFQVKYKPNSKIQRYCSTAKYNGEFKCVFGWFDFNVLGDGNLKSRLPRLKYQSSSDSSDSKNGIEILGMIPERHTDGSYNYRQGACSISELKAACKMNGIKKYSKKDKCELVVALMKC